MIARHWHGRVPTTLAADYFKLMREIALPDYRATAGNLSALCLHRPEGDTSMSRCSPLGGRGGDPALRGR